MLDHKTPEEDFYAWATNTAARARAGVLTPQELEEIAEEIEGMAKSERRELRNRLSVLLLHLLKWQYQPGRRGTSWKATVLGQRDDVDELLDENPSLRPQLPEIIERAYRRALRGVVGETGLDMGVFPHQFQETGWTLEQVLDEEYFPD